jgi:short-chain Z-isoprenyl diphosphate synthase
VVLHALYARRLRARLAGGPVPRHVAIIMDGNRRWARQNGFSNVSVGHRYGAEHIEDVLGWCAGLGIRYVTVFVASIDNLAKRSASEVGFLMQVAERLIPERLARPGGRWRIHVAGHLDVLPDSTVRALKLAEEATRDRDTDAHLTLAVGYGGRAEVVDALRSLLREEAAAGTSLAALAETITPDDIAAYLYTSGQPDPDLVIRTSGEQRLSDFLLWQTAGSELHFCDVYWPAFRYVDFLRALRSYADRKRR